LAMATRVPAQDAPEPAPTSPPVESGTPAAQTATPGKEAVKRVKSLGFRLSSKEPVPGTTPSSDAAPPNPGVAVPPGEMRLGRVEEPVSLPPEAAELAKGGALAVADGDWQKARDLYLKLVEAAPDNALAYANLGVAEHQLGNLLAAAGNLGKSTTLNPHVARN